jgi:hypothetical protein
MRFDAGAVGDVHFCGVSAIPEEMLPVICESAKSTMLIKSTQPILFGPIVCLDFVRCVLLWGIKCRSLRGQHDGSDSSSGSFGG